MYMMVLVSIIIYIITVVSEKICSNISCSDEIIVLTMIAIAVGVVLKKMTRLATPITKLSMGSVCSIQEVWPQNRGT